MFLKSHKRTPSGRNRIDITLNVEKMTSEERLSRQLHSPVRRSPSNERPHLFEWFLVIGVDKSELQTKQQHMQNTSSEFIPTPPPPKQQTPSTFKFLSRSPPPPPKEVRIERDTPKILYQYPPDKSLGSINVQDFPFPSGVPLNYQSLGASNTNLFTLLCSQNHLKEPEDSFVFMLTDDKKDVLYGICTFKTSEVSNKMTDVDVFEDSSINATDSIITAPKCYVILSKYPIFQLHFNILNSILKIQHMQQVELFQSFLTQKRSPVYSLSKPNSTTMESPPAMHSPFTLAKSKDSNLDQQQSQQMNLPQENTSPITISISNETQQQVNITHIEDTTQSPLLVPNIQITSDRSHPIKDLIEYFYQQTIPTSNQEIGYQIPSLDRKISFRRAKISHPEEDYPEYILEYGFLITMQILPHVAIINIINSILLERKIVFYSKSLRNLTSVIFTMISLLKPFVYQSVLLPIIPNSLSDIFSAPVPFIVGVNSKPENIDLTDVIFVDIDQKSIIQKSKADLLFPMSSDLANKIIDTNKALKAHMEIKNQINYSPTQDQVPILDKLSASFNKHFEMLFENFHRHCVRDVSELKHVSVFVKETFAEVEFEDDNQRNWIKEFMSTQIFSVYQDKKLRELDGE